MTHEEAFRAIEYYQLYVLPPTGTGVREESRWYACTTDRLRYGFGPTAFAAIEAATKHKVSAPAEDLEFLG